MARAPLARPTDAPPRGARAGSAAATVHADPGHPRARAAFLPPDDLPRHVAIIMDGNRRWARQRDLPELDGHAAGVEAIRDLLRHAVRRGVPVMTLYAFSRENWARSDDEVTGLFELLEAAIRSETDELRAQGVRDPPARPARRAARRDAGVDRRGARRDRPVASGCCSTSRSTTPAGPSSSTPSGDSPRAASRPTRSTRARSAPPCTRPACPTRTWSSGPAASSASPTSSSGSPPTPSSIRCDALWPDFGPDAFDAALLEFASRQRRFGR